MTLGHRLREQRERAGLSLGQAAKYEGIGRQYLSKLELGVNEPPTWPLLARLAERYDCSADYLLGLAEDPVGGRALAADERALLAAWHALPGEQRAVLLDLLTDQAAFAAFVDAVQALTAVNARLGRVRIIGGASDEEEKP